MTAKLWSMVMTRKSISQRSLVPWLFLVVEPINDQIAHCTAILIALRFHSLTNKKEGRRGEASGQPGNKFRHYVTATNR